MSTLQSSGLISYNSKNTPNFSLRRRTITKAVGLDNIPNFRPRNIKTIDLSKISLRTVLPSGGGGGIIQKHVVSIDSDHSQLVIEKLYTILEEVSDRIEMHNNIKDQRENWNSLLLTSINTITLSAATISAISATTDTAGSPVTSLKLASTLLYVGATGLLIIMNKLQPSQLVEEQRNAVRLFKQLENQIKRIINIGNATDRDVKESMEKVLALDSAFPLPLLGGVMLEKFPENVEPAVWWPTQRRNQIKESSLTMNNNGWNGVLEREMKEIEKVIKGKDKLEYLRLGKEALKMNKVLAVAGPLLTGLAAIGSASNGSWAAMFGVVGGALASVVNAVEHGGQIGMVFEMYRNNAGFFKLMEESIESNLMEKEVERRENGELFEMKVALRFGRSLSELRNLASSSSSSLGHGGEDIDEFASKLF